MAAAGPIDLAIIDSGMGGLDVAARLIEALRGRRIPTQIAFVDVRPRAGRRFEDDIPRPEKIALLGELLASVEATLAADQLALACNSLSALVRETRFAARFAARLHLIDVIGLDPRCELDARGPVIVLGTALTVGGGAHRRWLRGRRVAADRIVEQACPGLANSIQEDHRSPATSALIERYVGEAIARLPPLGLADADATTTLVLACTHFGFIAERLRARFEAAGLPRVRVVDANRSMAAALAAHLAAGADAGEPTIRVYSRHPPGRREHASLLELIAPVSPTTAAALGRIEALGGAWERPPAASRRLG